MCDETLRGMLSFSPPSRGGEEDYEGQYEVTPGVEAQTLETKGKLLTEDILIRAIPYSEIQNKSGGKTVHIATTVAATN